MTVEREKTMKNNQNQSDRIRFFHLCTDGESNGIVHTCDNDYRMATIISAILAYSKGVNILSFCHMSTHSHFVVVCGNKEQARDFIDSFKRDYSRYVYLRHGVSQIYLDIKSDPIEIFDEYHLKRCIAYVLLNPVVPKIVIRPEDYRWSSFNAYFNADRSTSGHRNVSTMTFEEIRKIFHTHKNIKNSGIVLDSSNEIVLKSIVGYETVERLFGGRTEFFKALALTDSVQEECKYVPHIVRYNDNELFAEAVQLAQKKYGTKDLQKLTHEQKLSLLLPIKRKTSSTSLRIAKVLRLSPTEVGNFLLKK